MRKPCRIYENIDGKKKSFGDGFISILDSEVLLELAGKNILIADLHIKDFDDVDSFESGDPYLEMSGSFFIVFEERGKQRKFYIE